MWEPANTAGVVGATPASDGLLGVSVTVPNMEVTTGCEPNIDVPLGAVGTVPACVTPEPNIDGVLVPAEESVPGLKMEVLLGEVGCATPPPNRGLLPTGCFAPPPKREDAAESNTEVLDPPSPPPNTEPARLLPNVALAPGLLKLPPKTLAPVVRFVVRVFILLRIIV